MATSNVQQGVREAIGQTDELGKTAKERHQAPLGRALDMVRDTLVRIDKALGGGEVPLPFLPDLERALDELADVTDKLTPELKTKVHEAVLGLRRFERSLEHQLHDLSPSLEIPSKKLLGVLPLVRMVPQDIHSLLDYANAAATLGSAALAESNEARIAGATLGGSLLVVSALTDVRLSAAKVVPVEAHQAIDHLWGAASIAAPFVLGYWKKEPAVAAIQVLCGATSILTALFTDYRAAKGVGHSDEERAAALADHSVRHDD
jgi:hypothetical protein